MIIIIQLLMWYFSQQIQKEQFSTQLYSYFMHNISCSFVMYINKGVASFFSSLSQSSCCYGKTLVYLTYTFPSQYLIVTEEVKAGTTAAPMKEHCVLSYSSWLAQFAFLDNSEPPAQGWHHLYQSRTYCTDWSVGQSDGGIFSSQ